MKTVLLILLSVAVLCSIGQAAVEEKVLEKLVDFDEVGIKFDDLPEGWFLLSESQNEDFASGLGSDDFREDVEKMHTQVFFDKENKVTVKYFKPFPFRGNRLYNRVLKSYGNSNVVVRVKGWIVLLKDGSNNNYSLFMKLLEAGKFEFAKLKGALIDKDWLFLGESKAKDKQVENFSCKYHTEVEDIYYQLIWADKNVLKVTYIFADDEERAKQVEILLVGEDKRNTSILRRKNIIYIICSQKRLVRRDVVNFIKKIKLPEEEKESENVENEG